MSKWRDADPKGCYDPKPKNVFDEWQPASEPDLIMSTNNWCQSCYSLYKDICMQVAYVFSPHLPIEDGEFKIEPFNAVIEEIANSGKFEPDLYENVLTTVLDCIIARRYQHTYCYKPVAFNVTRGIIKGDLKHEAFVVALAHSIDKIRNIYLAALNFINIPRKGHKYRHSVLDKPEYAKVMAVVDHLVKHTKPHTELKDIREDMAETLRKSFTLKRKIKKIKASKKKSKYKVTLPRFARYFPEK